MRGNYKHLVEAEKRSIFQVEEVSSLAVLHLIILRIFHRLLMLYSRSQIYERDR